MWLGKQFFGTTLGQAVFGLLVAQYMRLIAFTTKWQFINKNVVLDLLGSDKPIILVTWHGRLMMAPIAWVGRKPLILLVSRHGDGELFARAMGHFNMVMVRGSTNRPGRGRDKGGSAAMRKMLKLLKNGRSIGITPDGPRGPAMKLSTGVIALARLSGASIVPLAVCTKRYHTLRTWDQFRFALPFSKGVVVYGKPIFIDRRLLGTSLESERLGVETALTEVTSEADRLTEARIKPHKSNTP